MTLPIGVESRASEELAAFIATLVDTADSDTPVTLGYIRERILGAARAQGVEPLRSGSAETLAAEIETLIEEFGDDASAADFVAVKASEDLSKFIETLLDMSEADVVPTLGGMRTAVVDGWAARLAGDGVIDEDSEQTLLAELDALIARYGADKPAEDVLGFE